MKEETVAYPMSYRSAAEWESMLTALGATSIASTYRGFTMFTVYGVPMLVIRATMAIAGPAAARLAWSLAGGGIGGFHTGVVVLTAFAFTALVALVATGRRAP
ncbi:hypothetical protein [Micromonospora halophytica]|uniref:Uncharacterized protein n=1 Tax=Micromonospora halophytica TaxID=47864 RepID=A0A1C5IV79_9ACTN|nr:hypothetical protein [Micromonospora halophytica]SCG62258.1 hypothetical protein GA0070560_11712 [Micromonospora halophytica]